MRADHAGTNLRVGRGGGKLGDDGSARQDEDARGGRAKFGEVGAHEDDGRPASGGFADLVVDGARRAEVHPARRLGETKTGGSFGARAARATTIFCWLPPEQGGRGRVPGPAARPRPLARARPPRGRAPSRSPDRSAREAPQLAEHEVVRQPSPPARALRRAGPRGRQSRRARPFDLAPSVGASQPRQDAHELSLSVALDARDPDNLARGHLERHPC